MLHLGKNSGKNFFRRNQIWIIEPTDAIRAFALENAGKRSTLQKEVSYLVSYCKI